MATKTALKTKLSKTTTVLRACAVNFNAFLCHHCKTTTSARNFAVPVLRGMRSAVNPGFHLPDRLDCPSPSRLKMFSGDTGQSNGNNADAKWDDPDEICHEPKTEPAIFYPGIKNQHIQ